ncbi:MAG: lysophospholipid acyltransferase family protein [Candidatus Marinimicrobia bacterium]|jgi:1-acyl-sn-glycerol-3-phosphate acyltransferase|nr:lysophospholipid acyltransferase family protein [Candidatus Neomarinimicrobiota bacterium]
MRVIWFLINLLLSISVCSIPIIAVGLFDKGKYYTGKLIKMWARWVIWSTGIQYEIDGLDNLNLDKQYIFMSNHESALDIVLGLVAIPFNIVFLAKKELFRVPIFGWAMNSAGMIKIDRQNPEIARRSVTGAVETLKHSSFSTLIYPEGTRSNGEELLPFKKGGFILAIRTQFPVVPITILGAGNVLPKGTLAIKKSHIKIIIDVPLETQGLELKNKEILLQDCRNIIHQNLIQSNHGHNANYKLYST